MLLIVVQSGDQTSTSPISLLEIRGFSRTSTEEIQGFGPGATQAQISPTYGPDMEEPVFDTGLRQHLCVVTGAQAEGWHP